MSQKTKALLIGSITYLIWGFSFIFSKMGLACASPVILLMYRFFTAFIVINIVGLVTHQKLNLKGKRIGKLMLLGVLYPTVYFACENYGLKYSSATFSGLMIAIIPVASLAFASIVLNEKPTWQQVVFSLCALVGVAMVSISPVGGKLATTLGVVLMVGAVLAGTSQSILGRNIAHDFTVYEKTYFMYLEGCILYIIAGTITSKFDFSLMLAPLKEKEFLMAIGYLGVLASVVASLCQNYAIVTLTVAELSSFANMTTILSVVSGIIIMHEPFSFIIIPASILILIGVWGVQVFEKERIEKKKSKNVKQ